MKNVHDAVHYSMMITIKYVVLNIVYQLDVNDMGKNRPSCCESTKNKDKRDSNIIPFVSFLNHNKKRRASC